MMLKSLIERILYLTCKTRIIIRDDINGAMEYYVLRGLKTEKDIGEESYVTTLRPDQGLTWVRRLDRRAARNCFYLKLLTVTRRLNV